MSKMTSVHVTVTVFLNCQIDIAREKDMHSDGAQNTAAANMTEVTKSRTVQTSSCPARYLCATVFATLISQLVYRVIIRKSISLVEGFHSFFIMHLIC